MFFGIGWIGIEDIFDIGFAVGEVESFDFWHGSEEANNGLIGVDVGHGFFRVGGMRFDT